MSEPSGQSSDVLKGTVDRLEHLLSRLETCTQLQSDITDLRHDMDNGLASLKSQIHGLIESLAEIQLTVKSHSKDNPGILTRLQQIDTTIETILKHLDDLQREREVVFQNDRAIESFKVSCDNCREKMALRFMPLDKTPEQLALLQKSFELVTQKHEAALVGIEQERKDRRDFARNIWLAVIGQALTVAVGVIVFLWNQSRDIENHLKDPRCPTNMMEPRK